MTAPLLLGYWRIDLPFQPYPNMTDKQQESYARVREQARTWPDVKDFVDSDWAADERQLVAEYLERGRLVNQ